MPARPNITRMSPCTNPGRSLSARFALIPELALLGLHQLIRDWNQRFWLDSGRVILAEGAGAMVAHCSNLSMISGFLFDTRKSWGKFAGARSDVGLGAVVRFVRSLQFR